jgi:hypothetical protein
MKSYELVLNDETIYPNPYTLLAQVKQGEEEETYWIVAATVEGFIGIVFGDENNADMSNLPGLIWEEVTALGTTEDPEVETENTVVRHQLETLWSTAKTS